MFGSVRKTHDVLTSRHQCIYLLSMKQKMLTLRLPPELHKALKLKCVAEGQEMNAVVTKLIEEYLKESKPKKQK